MISPVFNNLTLLMNVNMIARKDPGIIVGPICDIFGYILNFLFNIAYSITVPHSLGISIILLTFVARTIMLPLAFKQQKSMSNMQKLQPEIEKIRKKYGDKKDAQTQQKLNAEIQALYAKNKINPLAGCLPLVVQMPIFFALYYIMQQSYKFIGKLNDIYSEMSAVILNLQGEELRNVLYDIVLPKIPKGMAFEFWEPQELMKALNKFSNEDWIELLSRLPSDLSTQLAPLLELKQSIEYFFGLSLIDPSSLSVKGLIIPVLTALMTFLSSYLMNKQTVSTNANTLMQQRMMLIVMPIMMGFMTYGLPAGVGLYWISSSAYQVCQQFIMNKTFKSKFGLADDKSK